MLSSNTRPARYYHPKYYNIPSKITPEEDDYDTVLLYNNGDSGNQELYLATLTGTNRRRITTDPNYSTWWGRVRPPIVQPDGSVKGSDMILAYRTPLPLDPAGITGPVAFDDYAWTSLWMMNPDGSNLHEIIPRGGHSWTVQGHAEFHPLGNHLCMFGTDGSTTQIFRTNLAGEDPVQLSDNLLCIDPSWHPNGDKIIYVAADPSHVYTVDVDMENPTATAGTELIYVDITKDDFDPYYTEDGVYISWITNMNPAANLGIGSFRLNRALANGTELTLLSTGPTSGIFGQGPIDSKPHFLGSTQIFYHSFRLVGESGKWVICMMLIDGTGVTMLTEDTATSSYYPFAGRLKVR